MGLREQEFRSVTFASPLMLFGLLAVPVAWIGYVLLELRRANRAAPWSTRAMLPNTVTRPPERLRSIPAACFLLGLTFLLVGFARPQRLVTSSHAGPTVVLTFDVSGSMAATDVQPTRILAARRLAIQFLNELPPKDEAAVVTFANTVNVAVAPTLDRKQAIAGLPTAATLDGGTAIGDAVNGSLAVAVAAVGEGQAGNSNPPGAVLLFSDGGQTATGTAPADAATHAQAAGIPIDTVSIGTKNGIVAQKVQLNDRQTSIQRIAVPAEPGTLQEVSQVTNGTFFGAPSAARLASVYEHLGSHVAHARKKQELNGVTAVVALIFILAGFVLSGLWFSRLA